MENGIYEVVLLRRICEKSLYLRPTYISLLNKRYTGNHTISLHFYWRPQLNPHVLHPCPILGVALKASIRQTTLYSSFFIDTKQAHDMKKRNLSIDNLETNIDVQIGINLSIIPQAYVCFLGHFLQRSRKNLPFKRFPLVIVWSNK